MVEPSLEPRTNQLRSSGPLLQGDTCQCHRGITYLFAQLHHKLLASFGEELKVIIHIFQDKPHGLTQKYLLDE